MFAKIKGDGFSFIHPDYVEKQNGGKWDIIPVAIPVTSVSLNPDKVALNVGENKSLTATVLPEDASNKSVVWTSSNTAVATVDQAGKVTAVAAGSAEITVTTVNKSKTATCSVTVKKEIPAGALGGEFSVSNDGGTTIKQVYFSQGNLWYGKVGDAQTATFNFEANQYDTTPESNGSWSTDHISHFFWSRDARVAYSENYQAANTNYNITPDQNDVFFTNETETTSKNDFTVNVGGTEQTGWRTLSTAEWQYLFNNTGRMVNSKPCYSNAVSGVSIGGTTYKGVFIYPDNYNGDVVSSSMTWDQINAAGIVFLPAAGYRDGSYVNYVGVNGYYWSSSALDGSFACRVFFNSYDVYPGFDGGRYSGFSVRLITESK